MKAYKGMRFWLYIFLTLAFDGAGGITSTFLIVAMTVTVHTSNVAKVTCLNAYDQYGQRMTTTLLQSFVR